MATDPLQQRVHALPEKRTRLLAESLAAIRVDRTRFPLGSSGYASPNSWRRAVQRTTYRSRYAYAVRWTSRR